MSINTSIPDAAIESRKLSWFTSGTAIVLSLALARMALYCVAGPHYGYFRDELYYLACGEHPAWGYVDQPPLIAWMAWLVQHAIGTSLWALRLLPALAGAATIVLAGGLARPLGGRRGGGFFACVVVRIAKSGREPLWIFVGALAGITILNKYGVVFWLVGLVIGVCLTPLRESLRQRWFWLGCAVAAAIALPNFFWQWQHQFPFLQLMHNVRENGRDISLAPLAFRAAQARMLGYAAALLAPAALLFFFSKQGRPFRALGWAYVVFLAVMMALHGKMYYLAPVYPMVFAAGAVWVEGATRRRLWVWAKPALAAAMVAVDR